ncbi:MAG: TetR/AcrR family transcriptional regulator [Chloroflexota bacterium]
MLSIPTDETLDPRVKRTRNLLEQAFMEVVAEKGFQAVSVQDIAERAGINRATFYAHFPDKYALLDHSIRQMFRQELEKRMLSVCTFSLENLRQLVVAVCEFVAKANSHCAPPQPQFESLVEAQVKAQLQDLLQNWIEQTGSDVDPRIAATATSWAIYGLALQWSHDKKRSPVETFADQVLPLIASNLRLIQPA